MNNKRTFVKIIITVLVVVVVGAVYIVWSKENTSISQVTESTQPAEKSTVPNVKISDKNTIPSTSTSENWKTYSNKDYGFSFQYPSDWKVNDQSFTSQGKLSINVSVTSPVHTNITPTQNAVYILQMGMTPSGLKMADSNATGFFKSPFTQADGGPVKLNISNAVFVGSSEYKQAQKIFESFLPWINLSLGWKNLKVEPAPNKVSFMWYPPNWDGSVLRFSCQNPTDQILAAISPARTDLPGYKNVSAAYLVQFCAGEKSVLNYQGFIKAPLSRQPVEQDKIMLSDTDLKNTKEYLTAQQIIFLHGDTQRVNN